MNEGGNTPGTRSLPELVRALQIVDSELGFQNHRLEEHVKPRTESEVEYFENLKEGYGKARYWLGILRRYHEGRLERLGENVADSLSLDGIDEKGRATAFADDEDTPL
jgi:hypothetical protein